MPSTRSYRELHQQVAARPGAEERLAALRAAALEEIRLYRLERSPAAAAPEKGPTGRFPS